MDTGSGFPSENYRQMLSLLFYLFFFGMFCHCYVNLSPFLCIACYYMHSNFGVLKILVYS